MGIVWEIGFGTFLLVTVILGGGASYLTGRAIALTWRPVFQVVVYAVGLAFCVRFIHYALFGGTLLSAQYAIVDFLVLLTIGGIGFGVMRTKQMVSQYSWLYQRKGPFSWQERPQAGEPSGPSSPG